MLRFSSTDRDGTETSELWLGRTDWKDEVSPTICDDQVASDINITLYKEKFHFIQNEQFTYLLVLYYSFLYLFGGFTPSQGSLLIQLKTMK